MRIDVSTASCSPLARDVPDFPLVRFQSGPLVYEEALIEGQYMGVSWSATGRLNTRDLIWNAFSGGQTSWKPLRSRQHAFCLQIDGQSLLDHWQWVSGKLVSPAGSPFKENVVALKHSLRAITVKVHTRLDGTQFIRRWLEIENTGDRDAACGEVLIFSGLLWAVGDVVNTPLLVEKPFSLGRYKNTEWSTEGEFDWEPIPEGIFKVEHLHGLSGHGCPFFVTRNEVTGESLVGHIEWSGNWQMEFYNDYEPGRGLVLADLCPLYRQPVKDARLYFRVGMAGPAPLRLIPPGQSVMTPPVHLGYLFGDIDTCAQAVHQHLRTSVIPPAKQKQRNCVEYNHSGYSLNTQIKQPVLSDEIEIAARVGCELFMVDAGWFGDAAAMSVTTDEAWRVLVGDWQESPSLGGGLKSAFQRARETGMLCGLWTEIERVGSASQLLTAHPDWQMQRLGEVIPQLDLTNPSAAQFVEETVVRLIEEYRLDCFRLDYNVCIGLGAQRDTDSYNESTMWEYYDTLYAIIDRIKTKFPHLILENCASGGGRNDLGMMSRFHHAQLSDNSSPVRAIKILDGMTLALAPEQCLTWLGCISPGIADIDFGLRVGLFQNLGLTGLCPGLQEYNDTYLERVQHCVELYKSFVRPILNDCRVFHHTPRQSHSKAGQWCVLEYAGCDRLRAYVGIFRLPGASSEEFLLKMRGLDISRVYLVTFDNTGLTHKIHGFTLVNNGLNIRIPGTAESELLLFEAQRA